MTILNRPMFLQAGGEAGPEASMLQEAEAGAMAQGQQLGEQYAQQMMQGIDQAQSTEDLINALRGNDKPLDARRSELAGFVGQNDANETPESVLAMVQPVIMMTEEGVMDSGIGGLVQQIVGDVEMTTDSGAPTDMGMGVGSLMAAGAQEAPTPQNFRQGGEVAHLQEGSNMTATAPALSFNPLDFASENVMSFGDTVKGRYEDLLPLYQEILGADQESKDATKAQMLFDVAQAGLQLAAGVPGAGSSFVSQLAGAAAPAAENIQKRGAALDAERRALKSGALSSAFDLTVAEQEALLKARAATTEFEREKELEEIKAGGAGTAAERRDAFLTTNAGAYSDGSLSDKDTLQFQQYLMDQYNPAGKPVFDGKTYRAIVEQMPDYLRAAEEAREQRGRSVSGVLAGQQAYTNPLVDPSVVPEPTETYPEQTNPDSNEIPRSVAYEEFNRAVTTDQLSDAFGTEGFFKNIGNKLFGIVEADPLNEKVEKYLATYESARRAAVNARASIVPGRQSQEWFNGEYALFPDPASMFTSPQLAAAKIEPIVGTLKQDLEIVREKMRATNLSYDAKSLRGLESQRLELQSALGFWERFVDDLNQDLGLTGPLDSARLLETIRQVQSERGQ